MERFDPGPGRPSTPPDMRHSRRENETSADGSSGSAELLHELKRYTSIPTGIKVLNVVPRCLSCRRTKPVDVSEKKSVLMSERKPSTLASAADEKFHLAKALMLASLTLSLLSSVAWSVVLFFKECRRKIFGAPVPPEAHVAPSVRLDGCQETPEEGCARGKISEWSFHSELKFESNVALQSADCDYSYELVHGRWIEPNPAPELPEDNPSPQKRNSEGRFSTRMLRSETAVDLKGTRDGFPFPTRAANSEILPMSSSLLSGILNAFYWTPSENLLADDESVNTPGVYLISEVDHFSITKSVQQQLNPPETRDGSGSEGNVVPESTRFGQLSSDYNLTEQNEYEHRAAGCGWSLSQSEYSLGARNVEFDFGPDRSEYRSYGRCTSCESLERTQTLEGRSRLEKFMRSLAEQTPTEAARSHGDEEAHANVGATFPEDEVYSGEPTKLHALFVGGRRIPFREEVPANAKRCDRKLSMWDLKKLQSCCRLSLLFCEHLARTIFFGKFTHRQKRYLTSILLKAGSSCPLNQPANGCDIETLTRDLEAIKCDLEETKKFLERSSTSDRERTPNSPEPTTPTEDEIELETSLGGIDEALKRILRKTASYLRKCRRMSFGYGGSMLGSVIENTLDGSSWFQNKMERAEQKRKSKTCAPEGSRLKNKIAIRMNKTDKRRGTLKWVRMTKLISAKETRKK